MKPGTSIHLNNLYCFMNNRASSQPWNAMTISFSKALI
jgi:hypothetical protein